jgi:hypothetical protein
MVAAAKALLPHLATCLAACGPKARPAAPEAAPPGGVVQLELPSVDGDEVSFARWRGKRLVVHFAVTGSLDAQSDVEELRRTRERVRGLVLVEVVLDESGRRVAAPWANASGIDWSVLLPTPELLAGTTAFGKLRVVPTTFLVDARGRVAWRWEGALPRGVLLTMVGKLEAAGDRP